jgi:hypothetical protein
LDLNKPVVWVYALNATLLIVHEMDLVHWREWNLFSLSGLFAFGIHTHYIRKGKPKFTTPVSQAILRSILVTSILHAGITIRTLLPHRI